MICYQPCAELNTKNSSRWQLNVSEQATQSKKFKQNQASNLGKKQSKARKLKVSPGFPVAAK